MQNKSKLVAFVALFALHFFLCGARADSVVNFNELQYRPADGSNGVEWIELHNQMSYAIDLSDWSIAGGVDYRFAEGTSITARGYLVIASDPEAMATETTYNPVQGPFEGNLSNGGEELQLLNNSGRVMDAMVYSDGGDWPVAPDGSGATLAKRDGDLPSDRAESWRSGVQKGGTPGAPNFSELGEGWRALVPRLAPAWARVPLSNAEGTSWTRVAYNHWDWKQGRTGVGFETKLNLLANYAGQVNLDVLDEMLDKNKTCYVRVPFELSSPEIYTSLTLRMKYHGGFVAYLNGAEVARANVRDPLAWNSGAKVGRYGAQALRFADFDVSSFRDLLRPGRNILAIHGLCEDIGSPDYVVVPELHGLCLWDNGSFAFNELPSGDASEFWVELKNRGSEPFEVGGSVLRVLGAKTNSYVLQAGTLQPGEWLVLNQADTGLRPSVGDRLLLESPGGWGALDAVAVEDRLRGRCDAQGGDWLYPESPTPGSANAFAFHDEVAINEIMYHQRPEVDSPYLPPTYDSVVLLAPNVEWRFEPSGADLGTAWKEPSFSDMLWRRGSGAVGTSFGDLPLPLNTPLNVAGQTTVYFRARFEFTGELGDYELAINPMIDDGAVFYLNGVEVYRENMPDGPVAYSTLAKASVLFATLTGPTTISATSLVLGTNVLAIEVHQNSPTSTDLVMGTTLLKRKMLKEAVEPKTYADNPEEWIELFNRSDRSVDLSGWRLADGVDYAFESGVTLAPGAYLVVAKDSGALAERYPDATVVGNFDRSLSDSADRILLLDAAGNPADSVPYYDDRPWPYEADGYSASLELRDPWADNSKPEAWAASDEGAKTEWQQIRYRDRCSQIYGPSQWNEFVIGLLDAGEVLLDDFSIVENPDSNPVEMLKNGSFETEYTAPSGHWQFVGTHRHSSVIEDPESPGNHVLHLKASGHTEPNSNHVTTTLKKAVRDGYDYEISFRAKWLAGSNQLNTRLYFIRLARTTLLDTPKASGTPGAVNSRYEQNIGPTFSDLSHWPVLPKEKEPVTVSVRVSDPDGVSSCTLHYVENGYWNKTEEGLRPRQIAMQPQGDGLYSAMIAEITSKTKIQFYVEATDGSGATAIYPPEGRDSGAYFTIADDQAALTGINNLRMIFGGPFNDYFYAEGAVNSMSNDRMLGTLIDNEKTVYYNVGIRLKGSGRGRPDFGSDRTSYSAGMPSDRLYRSVHKALGIDRSPPVASIGNQQEVLIKHMYNRAGVPCMYDDLTHFISPRAGQTRPVLLLMAQYDSEFLASQWPDGSDGTVFDFDLTYYPTSTKDGSPEGPKMPLPDNLSETDLTDLGDDKEVYRWPLQIENNLQRDDYSGLIALCKAMGAPAAKLDAATKRVMDVEEWLRKYAMLCLCAVGDTYTMGYMHNLRIYVPPNGGKALALPWDMDFTFSNGATYPIIGGNETNMRRLTLLPGNKRLYYGHMRQMIDTVFNPTYMAPWLTEYERFLPGQNFDGGRNFIASRYDYVRSNLPASPGSPTFTVTSPDSVATTESHVTISGQAWIDAREFRILGREGAPLDLAWTSSGSGRSERFFWSVDVPVVFGENDLVFAAYDFDGNLITTDTVVVTSSYRGPALADALRVTEIHYAPIGGTEYEFIEFANLSDEALDLSNVVLSGAVDFDFSSDAATTTLSPGARGVVVQNLAVFESRYGSVDEPPLVLGQYSGKLSNSGDTLEVLEFGENKILEIAYSDGRGWPLAADGAGHSLVPLARALADETSGSLAYGGNWRASSEMHGSPGRADPEPPAGPELNEILAGEGGWVELRNSAPTPAPLADWFLSDDPAQLDKWPLPAAAPLAAWGRVAFGASDGIPAPHGEGGELYLSHLPSQGVGRVASALDYKAQEQGAALGRWPESAPYWLAMAPTRGASNGRPFARLVISECMYHVADGSNRSAYVELFNPTNLTVSLNGESGAWRLAGGVSFSFAADARLAPGEALLVVGFDPAVATDLNAFREAYGLGSNVRIVGPWTGALSNGGERVALEKPIATGLQTDPVAWAIVDELIYFDRAPFPTEADGGGASLQRVSEVPSGNDPANWIAADPNPGRSEIPARTSGYWVLY